MVYFAEHLKPIYELDKEIRGTILTWTVIIETTISRIISLYFCDDEKKSHLLFSLILCDTDIGLRTKIKIFIKLLRLYYPKWLEKYPKLPDDLEKIRTLRNKLAHSLLDTSEKFLDKFHKEGKNDRIQLRWWQGEKTKKTVITKNQSIDMTSKCSDIGQILIKIQNEIRKKYSV